MCNTTSSSKSLIIRQQIIFYHGNNSTFLPVIYTFIFNTAEMAKISLRAIIPDAIGTGVAHRSLKPEPTPVIVQ